MKNKLFQLGDSLLRILDSSGDLVLVIDCAKQTMPVWVLLSDIALYKPISEEELANVIGNIPVLETLDNEQIRTMHERYTMIVPIIPCIGDLKLRPCRIAEVSEEYKISKQSIRSYLCKYLSYMDMLALAPKGKNNDRELSVDEKNMRWGLNKFFYTQKKNSLHTAYTLMLKEKYCDPTGTLVDTYPSFYQFRYFYRKTKKMQNYYKGYLINILFLDINFFLRYLIHFVLPMINNRFFIHLIKILIYSIYKFLFAIYTNAT